MSVIAKLCALLAVAYCPQVVVAPKPSEDPTLISGYDSRLASINMMLGTIRINEGLTRNDHELAFVLGHELGHLMLRLERHGEVDADVYSVRLIKRAGYDCLKGIEVLRRNGIDGRWAIAKLACLSR